MRRAELNKTRTVTGNTVLGGSQKKQKSARGREMPSPELRLAVDVPKNEQVGVGRSAGQKKTNGIRAALLTPPSDVRPASAFVSYDVFESLVRDFIARMPDLAPYWALRQGKERAPEDDLYVMGGLFRGVASKIIRLLQDHSAAEIRAMPVPESLEFLAQAADRDLLVFNYQENEKVQAAIAQPGSGWEIVDRMFYRSSVLIGGTGLEKTAVNPDRIHDPKGGLRSLWEGKLTFSIDDRQLSKHPTREGYSGTALALRLIRYLSELPGVHTDAASLDEAIGTIQGERGELGKTASEKYFIEKPIKKLFNSLGEDPVRFFANLKSLQVLSPLAAAAVRIPELESLDTKKLIDDLLSSGLTVADLFDVRRLLRLNTVARANFAVACFERANTVKQALRLIACDPEIDPPTLGPLIAEKLRSQPLPRALAKGKKEIEAALDALDSPLHYFRARLVKNEDGVGSMIEVELGARLNGPDVTQLRTESRIDQQMLLRLPDMKEAEKTKLATFFIALLTDYELQEKYVDEPDAVVALLGHLKPKDPGVLRKMIDIVEKDQIIGVRKVVDALRQIAPLPPAITDHITHAADQSLAKGSFGDDLLALAPLLSPAHATQIREQLEAALSRSDDKAMRELLFAHRFAPLGAELEQRLFSELESRLPPRAGPKTRFSMISGWLNYVVGQGRSDLFFKSNELFIKALEAKTPEHDGFGLTWMNALERFPNHEPRAQAQALLLAHIARSPSPSAEALHHWSIAGAGATHPISITSEQFYRIVADNPIKSGRLGTYDCIRRLVKKTEGDAAAAQKILDAELKKKKPSFRVIAELLKREDSLKTDANIARIKPKLGKEPASHSWDGPVADRERLRRSLED